MSKSIKVIVAIDRSHFIGMCNDLKLNPRMVKYVNIKDVDKALAGYYREQIYPAEYGVYRPYAPDTDENGG